MNGLEKELLGFLQEAAKDMSQKGYYDVDWEDESSSWREGDILPGGILAFDAGVAEIDFF